MPAKQGHTLTKNAGRAAAKAAGFVRRFSRESVNLTPAHEVGGSVAPQTVTWPTKVTGPVIATTGSDAGLYPGTAYVPSALPNVLWDAHECWVRALPGFTLAAGDAGLGRLVGWRDDAAGGKPVYALAGWPTAGGSGPGAGGGSGGSGGSGGAGTLPQSPPGSVPGQQDAECIDGKLYVTRGNLSTVLVGGRLVTSWSQLYTSPAGCCGCPPVQGGSGGSGGSGSQAVSAAGQCCPDGYSAAGQPVALSGPWGANCANVTLIGAVSPVGGGAWGGVLFGAGLATGAAKLQCVGGAWEIAVAVTVLSTGVTTLVRLPLAVSGDNLVGTGVGAALGYGLCTEQMRAVTASVGHPCEGGGGSGGGTTCLGCVMPANPYLQISGGGCLQNVALTRTSDSGAFANIALCGGQLGYLSVSCVGGTDGDYWNVDLTCSGGAGRVAVLRAGTCTPFVFTGVGDAGSTALCGPGGINFAGYSFQLQDGP